MEIILYFCMLFLTVFPLLEKMNSSWTIITEITVCCSATFSIPTRWYAHHLFLCEDSSNFLKNVEKLLQKSLSVKLCFTICKIIFEIHIEHDTIINFVSYIIILGKWYINNCRTNAKTIQITEFQEIVKRKLRILLTLKPSHEKESMYKMISEKSLKSLLRQRDFISIAFLFYQMSFKYNTLHPVMYIVLWLLVQMVLLYLQCLWIVFVKCLDVYVIVCNPKR